MATSNYIGENNYQAHAALARETTPCLVVLKATCNSSVG